MIELPRALAHWQEDLAIFPEEVALSVVPWLPRLALAVGPLRARTNTVAGAPDGFGGLTRRGPYERLLLSEWLLADEMPDEFTRRAAMGEHAFLELARREPAGSKRSTVLFDAGPSQLGTPRIAHIAALIVLARRARDAGAELTWGILQEPDGWCYDVVSEASLMGLVEARCPHEPTSADVEDWLERLSRPGALDDVWLIGSDRLAGLDAKGLASKLEIRDPLEVEERRIRVSVRRAAKTTGEVELDLPDERACVRLLRDPFQFTRPVPRRAPRALNVTSNLLFSPDGRKLFTRGMDGSVISYRPPNSPRAVIAQPRILSPMGEQVAAIGTFGKESYLVTSDSKQLALRGFSRRGRFRDLWKGVPVPEDFPFWHPGDRSPLSASFVAPSAGVPQDGLVFVDSVGRLLFVRVREPKALEIIGWGVTAIARFQRHLVMVIDHASGWPLDFSRPVEPSRAGLRYLARLDARVGEPTPIGISLELECEGELEAYFGWGGILAHWELGVLATKRSETHWAVIDRTGTKLIELPSGARVFGVTLRGGHQLATGLLVLEDDRRTVTWVGQSAKQTIVVADDAIEFATASTARSDFAYITRERHIVVHSLEHGHLMRVLPAAPGAETEEEP